MTCNKCGKVASVQLTEIRDGRKTEKHLYEDCAAQNVPSIKHGASIQEILEKFVQQHTRDQADQSPID
jgi:protein-arginine kinase activator protein McsA